ncbi:MAG: hydroxymethylbilane synthase [Pirellulales bacterium]
MTNPPARLRLGTRASALARWQAEWVAGELEKFGAEVELVEISTDGDRQQSAPIGSLGAQGVFTKQIQQALLDGAIDLAVHSLKDLPTESIDGLKLAAVPPREMVNDVLVARHAKTLDDLPDGAVVGTGSLRRRAQLLHLRPDLKVCEIRGNVDTRLRKLDEGQCDATLLAAAGLRRLGRSDRITQVLAPAVFLPAVGQGALGIEVRGDDSDAIDAVGRLNDPLSHATVEAERTLLAALEGGCRAPIGAWGRVVDGRLWLSAVVLSPDGGERIYDEAAGEVTVPRSLGEHVAVDLLARGAGRLVDAARDAE